MDEAWITVVAYHDRPSAEATRGLLYSEQVPCYIASNEFVPGLGSNFEVRVPVAFAHRVRWIMEQLQISDGELNFLATGEIADGADGA